MSRDEVRFKVLRPLGGGGMADVFLAKMKRDGSEVLVALKRIRPTLSDSREFREQFAREAKVCALLSHEHITHLHHYGRDKDGDYLAFEYVEGSSAAAIIGSAKASARKVSVAAIAQLAADIAKALQYAHGIEDAARGIHGVVHRDVSPDNILVTHDGIAKLSDFGIARMLGVTALTRTGYVKGKHGYLAPELYDGASPTPAADVFALGVVLYRLASGVPPFHGQNDVELMRAVISARAPSIRTLRPDLPEPLAKWIDGAIGSRETRPTLDALLASVPEGLASREALATEVQRAVSSGAAHAAATNQTQTFVAGRRGRWIAGGAVAAGAFVVAAAGIAWRASEARGGMEGGTIAAVADAGVSARSAMGAEQDADTHVVVDLHPPGADAGRADEATQDAAVDPARPDAGTQAELADTGHAVASAKRRATFGTLVVKVSPWGHVFIDGSLIGPTPLKPLKLAPGPHAVLVVGQDKQTRRSVQVNIRAGKTETVRLSLE